MKNSAAKNGSDVWVNIKIKKDTHRKIVLKQLDKFDRKKTIAEICSLAIEKGIDKV